jgi:L-rhamnose isomerase
MTYQVAISLDCFFANSNEINAWLVEYRGTSEFNSYLHPIPKLRKAAVLFFS